MAACGSSSAGTLDVHGDAVTPTTSGCSAAASCAPDTATDVGLAIVPTGMTAVGGEQTQPLDAHHTIFTRVWESSVPSFLNPGGQPIGPRVEVELMTHPATDPTGADAMAGSPRAFSGISIGPRRAFVSTWAVSTKALDGVTPMQVTATSIYIDLSPTLRLQIDTLGLTASQAAKAALGAMVR